MNQTPTRNLRIHLSTIKNLRRFEKKTRLKPNISKTIDYLLSLAEEAESEGYIPKEF